MPTREEWIAGVTQDGHALNRRTVSKFRAKYGVADDQQDAPPSAPRKLRGLGDVVAAVTSAVGIKPCGPCKARQEALNRAVPFGK
ncbi:MAG TPA: hypothetical protein VM165_14220 [Planctomycetaceae bacterium]|nr:hypothetical protein [Planctomycetaceae bacterium]